MGGRWRQTKCLYVCMYVCEWVSLWVNLCFIELLDAAKNYYIISNIKVQVLLWRPFMRFSSFVGCLILSLSSCEVVFRSDNLPLRFFLWGCLLKLLFISKQNSSYQLIFFNLWWFLYSCCCKPQRKPQVIKRKVVFSDNIKPAHRLPQLFICFEFPHKLLILHPLHNFHNKLNNF